MNIYANYWKYIVICFLSIMLQIPPLYPKNNKDNSYTHTHTYIYIYIYIYNHLYLRSFIIIAIITHYKLPVHFLSPQAPIVCVRARACVCASLYTVDLY